MVGFACFWLWPSPWANPQVLHSWRQRKRAKGKVNALSAHHGFPSSEGTRF